MPYLGIVRLDDGQYFISVSPPDKDHPSSEVLPDFGAVICKVLEHYQKLSPDNFRDPICFGLNWHEVRAVERLHELMRYGKPEQLV